MTPTLIFQKPLRLCRTKTLLYYSRIKTGPYRYENSKVGCRGVRAPYVGKAHCSMEMVFFSLHFVWSRKQLERGWTLWERTCTSELFRDLLHNALIIFMHIFYPKGFTCIPRSCIFSCDLKTNKHGFKTSMLKLCYGYRYMIFLPCLCFFL